MDGRTFRVTSLHPNEEKCSQKRTSRNEWSLRSVERLYSAINCLCIILLTTDILYLQPVCSFKTGNFLWFIESQFTTKFQVSLSRINAHMDTSDHNSRTLSKVPGRGCECFDRHKKCVDDVSSFSIGAEYKMGFEVSHM